MQRPNVGDLIYRSEYGLGQVVREVKHGLFETYSYDVEWFRNNKIKGTYNYSMESILAMKDKLKFYLEIGSYYEQEQTQSG